MSVINRKHQSAEEAVKKYSCNWILYLEASK